MSSSKVAMGFTVMLLPFKAESEFNHQLFVKEYVNHNPSADKPPDRTLFVLNVPPYATEASIKRVFSCAGPVRSVTFESKPNPNQAETVKPAAGFKVAYIVYQKSTSVDKALSLTQLEPLSTRDHPVRTGVAKWVKEYNDGIVDHEKLKEEATKVVVKYDKEEEKRRERKKMQDDDGWTVVGKKGRRPGLSRKESVSNKLLEKTSRREKRTLPNFYSFQNREGKRKRVVEMRKAYEDDKKKVAAMKVARKFQPH